MAVMGIISCNKYNVPPPTTGSNATLDALHLQEFITFRGDLYLPLSPGWVPGRLRDNTDAQWHKLRPFALPLVLGMFIHSGVGRIISRVAGVQSSEHATMVWHAGAGFMFCVFLHGPRALWAVAVALLNYIMCVVIGKRTLFRVGASGHVHALPCCAWALNITLLLLCNLYDGFSYIPFSSWAGAAGASVDSLVGDGAYNWQIQFNLTFLRLISFCMDRL
jgi:hypothetical protein